MLQKIVCCYGDCLCHVDSIPNVEFIERLQQRENFARTKRTLLITDDLMNETNRILIDLLPKAVAT